jgi:hypothetical protein
MNDDERARVLRMVAEGKISPEEAADLLEAIQSSSAPRSPEPASMPEPPSPPAFESRELRLRRRGRFLVIHVKEGGDNKVNVRIPLNLTRAAGKFIPRSAQTYLNKYEINLQEFLDDISETEGGGTLLEVRDGDNKVLIAVE